jgi:hypothetical protein
MSMGLLHFRSAADLKADEHAEQQRLEQERRQLNVESSLASHIRRSFDQAKTSRQPIDERLLDCLRRFKGEYSEEKLRAIQEEGGSTLYPKLTTTKVRAAISWIIDIMLPAKGRAWGLDPTTIADLPPELVHAVAVMQAQEEAEKAKIIQPSPDDIQGESAPAPETSFPGQPQAPAPQAMPGAPAQGLQALSSNAGHGPLDYAKAEAHIRQVISEKAKEACNRHEDLIEDQLQEGGWKKAQKEVIADFCTFPVGIMKGPMFHRVTEFAWSDGWKPVQVENIKPFFSRVSPFDIYPSPDSTDINDGSYIIERELYTRRDLNKLRGVPGYKEEAIKGVLEDYGRGGLRDWLATDSERARIEDRRHDNLNDFGETIEGLHYWGSAQGLTLLQWGMSPDQIPDPLDEYEIDAILIGNYVIRCVINRNPMGARPYMKSCFQQVPGSFWGIAIPELMSDVQDMCCVVARAQQNNLAFASGPQIEVATDRLQPEEDPNEIYPMKRWRTKSDRANGGTNQPAIRFYQPASLAGELMTTYDQWEKRADDATNIPRYTYGGAAAGGAGSTASGLSMLLESANKGIKNAILGFDEGITQPGIYSLWIHNMMYSTDNSIKGDCKVIPQGATAQLLREQTQNARMQFLASTNNPTDMQVIGLEGRAILLRSYAESLDLPDLIPDADTLKAKAEQAEKAQAEQGQAQQQAMAQQSQMMQQQAEMQAQAQQQKLQIEATKAQADATQKQAAAEKIQAETQKVLLEVQGLLAQLSQMGVQPQPQVQEPAQAPAPQDQMQQGPSPEEQQAMEQQMMAEQQGQVAQEPQAMSPMPEGQMPSLPEEQGQQQMPPQMPEDQGLPGMDDLMARQANPEGLEQEDDIHRQIDFSTEQ